MNTEKMIAEVLREENKKNPLTDEEIAKKLNILREIVTEYRKKNNIANSRNRRLEYVKTDALEILKKDKKISDRALAEALKEKGYKVERYAASNIKKELISNMQEDDYINEIKDKKTEDIKDFHEQKDFFKEVVGYNGSLRVQVEQAKAAVSYPPHGLHVLILGPSGVGKSYLADAMYEFAKSTSNFSEEAKYIIFNCADYADNPQLLLSQLFGSVKGAYTGATENKMGIVEACDGGILFLDEIHRLPSEGQEILFSILDKGIFRRLGESETVRKSNVMIIAATTENVESSLLLTFRRRIPMVIEIPAIKDRPFEERFELINKAFFEESHRIKKDMLISKNVISELMKYECQGNIGQLKSDIQVACAISFLEHKLKEDKRLYIDERYLPDYIKEQSRRINIDDSDIEKFIIEDIYISHKGEKRIEEDTRYNKKNTNIYKFIEKRQSELKFVGYSDEEISKILSQQVELELIRGAKAINYNVVNTDELMNLVGVKSLETVKMMIKLAKKELTGLQSDIIYPLAVHLNSTYERIRNGKEIINPKLSIIKTRYEKEYNVAKKMCEIVRERLNIDVPEDEIGFITMYLKNYTRYLKTEEGKVAVIVMTHGRVASAMAEVANKFLGVDHAVGLDMDFRDSPDIMLEKAIRLVKENDQGKGCIILVDMGSLVTFGDIITAKTGIETRVIGRVDTLMVLEAVRKSALTDQSLEEIMHDLESDSKGFGSSQYNIENSNLSKVIVTLCITGKGSALKIKEYVENKIDLKGKDIEIIPIGFMDEDINSSLSRISKNKNIEAIVGTINPEFRNIPFISLEELMKGSGVKKLNNIISNKEENKLSEIIDKNVVFVNENYKYKDEALDDMVRKLIDGGYVKEEFLLSVFKREMLGDTYLKGGIAIPHGASEFVTKPTILITKLAKKIVWSENYEVDLIFLIALKDDSKKYFEQLYKIIMEESVLNKIKSSTSKEEILEILL
ncbi:sigma 54-interacting transcriptional regulator [Clostridium tertium]|jgi:transcriptional regulator with AAA-type ATPase domain/transcriptional regulatory protein LevR|uniref:sigma 54-interacting transcriptional regulator n=1 Tax=Clostridium tertium TaxID=1559 RepID=UPI000DCF9177|nr:sigma 54-interacting transcriptional regulator [Clostridium tertium]MBU6136586.1 sigma 54-interacting transcriptional regulator [Clostridium tertium]MDI9218274.1 sigma 54-interacting transcriptional regulator [Clostridium tertium]